ncbi:hypothetical protein T01_3172 [Trichinella spiralis]|uniref:Uncharacterized protein n=1 Tax=Trichinella spiralis TaxID=6334 RepID=A0A0V1AQD6_TRISP|nr:hypothetical protein T01_3172 [Trichinella spiralis]
MIASLRRAVKVRRRFSCDEDDQQHIQRSAAPEIQVRKFSCTKGGDSA